MVNYFLIWRMQDLGYKLLNYYGIVLTVRRIESILAQIHTFKGECRPWMISTHMKS